jgi:tryptophan synthase beta chain
MEYLLNDEGFVNKQGYFGSFGGAFVPEMLYKNIHELQNRYLEILQSAAFLKEFNTLLVDYVGRPSPLYYAKRLSEYFGFNLFLKREDLNHTGSHKINNTIGQILLAKKLGKKRIIAETGAGQHGVATATVCALMNIECVVYMGEIDVERQSPNVQKMKLLGATVVPVRSGSKTLKDATNEAMRDWIAHPIDTHYIIGSVVGPHPFPDMVSRFQSVISHEIRLQLQEKIGRASPDYVVACVGGGSNAIGSFYHFINDKKVKLIGVEASGKGITTSESAATTALGRDGILHGSRTLFLQTEDGQVQEAHSVSAGLDYPGIGPQHAYLHTSQRARFVNITDEEALKASLFVARHEGIIPALETCHSFAYLDSLSVELNNPSNLYQLQRKEDIVVVLCLSGDGEKDMRTYASYLQAHSVETNKK